MKLEQLAVLVKLMRGNIDSLAARSAKLVLVDGLSQIEAARQLGTQPNTVNNGVRRYKAADESIRRVYTKSQ